MLRSCKKSPDCYYEGFKKTVFEKHYHLIFPSAGKCLSAQPFSLQLFIKCGLLLCKASDTSSALPGNVKKTVNDFLILALR